MSVHSVNGSRHGHGREVLQDPKRNKGTAFTEAEREELGLRGLLPPRVSSLDAQRERVTQRLMAQPDPIAKYVFLTDLQERNETLFYRLLADRLVDLMPIVYTPTVGEACRRFRLHLPRRAACTCPSPTAAASTNCWPTGPRTTCA
jgi:hypothetical protein